MLLSVLILLSCDFSFFMWSFLRLYEVTAYIPCLLLLFGHAGNFLDVSCPKVWHMLSGFDFLQYRRKSPSISPRRHKSRSPTVRRRKSRSPTTKRHRRQRSISSSLSPTHSSSPILGSVERKNAIEKLRKEVEEERKR